MFSIYNRGKLFSQPPSLTHLFLQDGETQSSETYLICELRASSMTTSMTLGSYTFILLSLNFSFLKLADCILVLWS